jgi:soluble lytic murein transglycosylase-like protein
MAKHPMMLLLTVIGLFSPAFARSGEVPPAYLAVADFCGAPAGLLYAVATTESGRFFKGQGIRPWPWTLNVEGKGFYFETREQQFDALMGAISAGKVVDVGPMQLNWGWQYDRLISPWRATDPVYNLTAGCRILREYYDAQGAGASWALAIGKYHRGSDAPKHVRAATAYAARVLAVWGRL